MTQSRASAKACSDSRLSAADSDEWETKVVTPRSRRESPSSSARLAGVDEDEPFLAGVEGGDDFGGVLDAADRVDGDVGGRLRRRLRAGGDHAAGLIGAALEPAEQLFGVADGGGHADALHPAPEQVLDARQYGE